MNDGTASAEATLIYQRLNSDIKLPEKGDSVHIIGRGYKKVVGIKTSFSFLKIHVKCIGVISFEE